MKYIIEYLGGTRGDFLCNFLNTGQMFLKNSETRTSSTIGGSLKYLSMQSYYAKKSPEISVLDNHLYNCKDQFTPSHGLFYLSAGCRQMIKDRNFQICKITFGKKYYVTILIEAFFKNIELTPAIGRYLTQNNLPNVQENRSLAVDDFLQNIKNHSNYYFYNFFNKNDNQGKVLLDYEKLYLGTPDYDIFTDVEIEGYKRLVERTILPEQIELYGKKYYPRDYGYLDY
jgi:hypothetical protein